VSAGAPLRSFAHQLVGVLIVLGVWQLLSTTGVIPAGDLPSMVATLRTLGHVAFTGVLWPLVGSTLETWATGLGTAVAGGVALGLVIASVGFLRQAFSGVIEFLRPVPAVAVIPLSIVVFGVGQLSAVFLVIVGSVWPVLVQTIAGVRAIDSLALDTAAVFELSRRDTYRFVRLKGALPLMMTGIRLSSAIALILAVTAELIIGSPGLGQAINVAQQGADLNLMYALIVASGILGYVLNVIMEAGGALLVPWSRPTMRSRS
jgi:ABC-type nitrate/sulfonate/bicarbonate transport system permease component